MSVWAACRNPGGIGVILPIIRKLREMDEEVLLFASAGGKAVDLLTSQKETFATYSSPEEIIHDHGWPRVLVTSMCEGGGLGRDLVPLLRGKAPIFAVQDYWGGELTGDWADPQFRPDYLLVNDEEIGKEMVVHAWPDFSPERVIATGYPSLDQYFGYDVQNARLRVRDALGLDAEMPIVFVGGDDIGSGFHLGEVVAVLNDLGRPVYLFARPHPRTPDSWPQEMRPWQQAMARVRYGPTPVFDFFSQFADDLRSLLAAAHVVLSMFSTINLHKAVLHGDNIYILYPEPGMRRLREELQGIEEHPLVSLGCSAKAGNRKELRELLERSLTDGLKLEGAQRKHLRLDGKNAERAVNAILARLPG